MDKNEIILILKKHNAWRRGDESVGMWCPKEIGLAIDGAIELLGADRESEKTP